MPSAIRTEALFKNYRSIEVLRGLTFDVPENSVYALVGPNGAGKTTAIKIFMNIIRPTSGRAEVLGIEAEGIKGYGNQPKRTNSRSDRAPFVLDARRGIRPGAPFRGLCL
jgi:ABC-type multidrug transport system ATPase subunit